ncbi:MAG: Rrf2 family transcriptional regulator [Hyphomicrobiales bacterium]|nr:Rrf2 family transcriptional regulator [Hyphomicrobiales bacterium]
MRLTTYSDYALRVLLYLALQRGRLVTIQEISDQYGISRNHLMKLVHELGRNGFVETVRGKNGGLRLGPDPARIRVGDVIRVTEKDMDLVECFQAGNDACRIATACALTGVLHGALGAFMAVLDQHTLADLVGPPARRARMAALFPQDPQETPA